jgi:hypothetical protein
MAADQIDLELLQLIRRNPDIGQLAEAGIDTVDRLTRRDCPVHQPATFQETLQRTSREAHAAGRIASDSHHTLYRERVAVEYAF